MDQVLSLLSRSKLSKGNKKRQERYKQSIIGIEGESVQLRDQGRLPGGRGPKWGVEGLAESLGQRNYIHRGRKKSARCDEKNTSGPVRLALGCEKGRGVVLNGKSWPLCSLQSVGQILIFPSNGLRTPFPLLV